MRTAKISAILLGTGLLWVSLLSLLGSVGGSVAVSVPATDGSQASIRFIDKAKFYADKSGEISIRMEIIDADQKPILGLSSHKVQVREEGIEVSLKSLNGPGTQPINVVLVIDISGSMRGRRIEEARDAALAAVSALQIDRDRIGLIVFDNNFDVLQPLAVLTTNVREQCQQQIRRLQPRGGTSIGPPTEEALQLVERASPNGPKLLLVMTDGSDPNLPSYVERIATASDALGVPVHTIAFGDHDSSAEVVLRNIANRCHGQYYFAPSGEVLANLYRSRVADASNEFHLVYDSPYPEADGLPRRVEVQVTSPSGTLITKDTYQIGPLITGGRRASPRPSNNRSETMPVDLTSVGAASFKVLLFLGLLSLLVGGLVASEYSPQLRSLLQINHTNSQTADGLSQLTAPQPQSSQGNLTVPAPPPPPALTSRSSVQTPSGARPVTTSSHSKSIPAFNSVVPPPPPPPPKTGSKAPSPEAALPESKQQGVNVASTSAQGTGRISPVPPPPHPTAPKDR